jgi:hypothetical protein
MLSILKKNKLSDMRNKEIYDMIDNNFEGYLLENKTDSTVKFDVDTYAEEVEMGRECFGISSERTC